MLTTIENRRRTSFRPTMSNDIWKSSVIKKVVTSYFQVTMEDLKIKKKTKYVLPRDIICYLIKQQTRSVVDEELSSTFGMERSLVTEALKRIRFMLRNKLYEYQDVLNCEKLVNEKLNIE